MNNSKKLYKAVYESACLCNMNMSCKVSLSKDVVATRRTKEGKLVGGKRLQSGQRSLKLNGR